MARRLDRPNRGDRALAVRGGLVLAAVAVTAAGAGVLLDAIFSARPALRLGEAVILASCLRLRAPWDAANAATRRLAEHDAAGAAAALGFPGRVSDEHAVARFGVERLCAELARGVAAPLFWYLLLGLPGLLLSTAAAATAAGLAGRRASPSFGRVPRLVDGALNAPPALAAAILIALSSLFVPGGRPAQAVAALWNELGRWPGQSLRWPVASAAGALGLALGGRSSYAGWIGQGTARATSRDLRRMTLTAAVSCLLIAAALAGLVVLSIVA